MENEYIAHSKNKLGLEHKLTDHLTRVATLMSGFIDKHEYKNIFFATGLLHDIGKYQPTFQLYLKEGGRRGSVPHASWGAAFSKKYNQIEAAFAIDGHHKGIPDKGDLISAISEFEDTDHPLFTSIREAFFIGNHINDSELAYSNTGLTGTDKELFIRMLFSALTDADWLDTENHFNEAISEKRKTQEFEPLFLLERIENELLGKSKEGYINKLRNNVRNYAIAKADEKPGFYSMTLPTGMGKTLASVSWALYHANIII